MPKAKIQPKCELDKFYTKPEVAKLCIDALLKLKIPCTMYIEPSLGNGSFFKQLPEPKFGMDICPELEAVNIEKRDYLTFKVDKGMIVIGNPPFGFRNKLTKEFIINSLGADVIAFILPQVFEKHTMQKVFPKEFALVESMELPKNSFLLNGTTYHVPCVFQIWVKNWKGLDKRKQLKWFGRCDDFKIDTSGQLFVFGSAPNKVINRDEVLPNNRGYYLLCEDKEAVREVFKKGNWTKYGKSSANGGSFWLSQEEFIDAYVKEKGLLNDKK